MNPDPNAYSTPGCHTGVPFFAVSDMEASLRFLRRWASASR